MPLSPGFLDCFRLIRLASEVIENSMNWLWSGAAGTPNWEGCDKSRVYLPTRNVGDWIVVATLYLTIIRIDCC